jgi:IS30 family transposase
LEIWKLIFSLLILTIRGKEGQIAAANRENLNGLIRQFIPKKTDFSQLSNQFIQQVQETLNRRPRKRFNFESPIEQVQKFLNNKVAFIS